MLDISTYLNRITSQHKVKPKYMALVAARLQPLIDLAECLELFDESFDLDNAVGKQLDIIGDYVGVNRLLDFQPQNATPVLSDPYYRMLIKARISLNNWDGTVDGIGRVMGNAFPQYEITVVDNQDMTLNVQIAGLQSLFESELIQHGYISPKPMGVLVDYYVLFSINLSTQLFVGGLAYDRFLRRGLPETTPANNSKPPSELFIAGLAVENHIDTSMPDKPPPTEIAVGQGQLYAGSALESLVRNAAASKPPPAEIDPPLIDNGWHGGILINKRVVTGIGEKPAVAAFDTQHGTTYESGIIATSMLRYALPSASV